MLIFVACELTLQGSGNEIQSREWESGPLFFMQGKPTNQQMSRCRMGA